MNINIQNIAQLIVNVVAPHTGSVDRNFCLSSLSLTIWTSLPAWRAWIEIRHDHSYLSSPSSVALRMESVNRNATIGEQAVLDKVVPRMGRYVIEIKNTCNVCVSET